MQRWRRLRRDDGQTIPLHLMAGVGLLFVALAFFAVGQAEDSRNGTQTAADAAALAAAKDARDAVGPDLLAAITGGDLDLIGDLLDGDGLGSGHCSAASAYAQDNGAEVRTCERVGDPAGYRVSVRSTDSVGNSVVDGTEDQYATATATAVIEPRCALSPGQEEPEPQESGEDEPPPSGDEDPPGDGSDQGGDEDGDQGDDEEGPGPPISLDCADGDLELDPADLDLDLGDLFRIRLTE